MHSIRAGEGSSSAPFLKGETMKDRLISIGFLFGFVAVICIFVYPNFMDALSNVKHISSLHAYDEGVSAIAGGEMDRVWEDLAKYNRGIEKAQAKKSFTYAGSKATDKTYESLLNPGGDGVMGTIEVPSAGIYLPIKHGTDADDLLSMAGHLYGTSLPVGGAGTHAVIAGHTGLQNADLFTGLSRVKEGDTFHIHVLGRTLTYRVDRIVVVLPEDEDPHLQVEPGRDLVTLYTCTPYGINSHRLLVRGTRDEPEEANADAGGKAGEKAVLTHVSFDRRAIGKCVFWAALPFLTLLIGLAVIFKKKEEKQEAETV